MVYCSIWYLVFGIWYLGIWYLVFGIWYLVFGIWYLVFGNNLKSDKSKSRNPKEAKSKKAFRFFHLWHYSTKFSWRRPRRMAANVISTPHHDCSNRFEDFSLVERSMNCPTCEGLGVNCWGNYHSRQGVCVLFSSCFSFKLMFCFSHLFVFICHRLWNVPLFTFPSTYFHLFLPCLATIFLWMHMVDFFPIFGTLWFASSCSGLTIGADSTAW